MIGLVANNARILSCFFFCFKNVNIEHFPFTKILMQTIFFRNVNINHDKYRKCIIKTSDALYISNKTRSKDKPVNIPHRVYSMWTKSIKTETKESNTRCEHLPWTRTEESTVKHGHRTTNWVWNHKDVMIIVSNGHRKRTSREKKKWKQTMKSIVSIDQK